MWADHRAMAIQTEKGIHLKAFQRQNEYDLESD